jgi:AraC-like DNA-binding protein
MKPELEVITPKQKGNSINFFTLDATAFKPYWHYHPEIELTLITKGRGTRFVGNSILPYKDGDLVLLGKNLPHHWVSSDLNQEESAIVIQFPSSLFSSIKECDTFIKFFELAAVGIHFPSPNKELLRTLHLFSKFSSIGRISQLMIIIEALQKEKNKKSLSSLSYDSGRHIELHQTKVSRTINYILDHLDKRLTVQELSNFSNMVPQSFCRWFKKSVGMSFITFVNMSRVERACHDLQSSDKPILEIAFGNGFESLSHFNRTFKKIKNHAPTSYKFKTLHHP